MPDERDERRPREAVADRLRVVSDLVQPGIPAEGNLGDLELGGPVEQAQVQPRGVPLDQDLIARVHVGVAEELELRPGHALDEAEQVGVYLVDHFRDVVCHFGCQ